MLFRKRIQKSCGYCVHGIGLEDGQILCSKKGFRNEENSCIRFRYDPSKRIPHKQKALDFSQFENENFTLEE